MQQNNMKQPPNVLSVKDVSYLKDMLSWNLLAAKKAKHFAQEAVDPEVKKELEATYQMHKTHYDQLLSLLQSNNNQ